MLSFFIPHEYHDSVGDVDYKKLYEKGIRNLLFDIDNTVATYDDIAPGKKDIEFFNKLGDMGFKIAFVSNNYKKRVNAYNKNLKFTAVYFALKPSGYGIKKAMRILNSNVNNTAMIGDQIFTDVVCGKMAGVYTVLVKPIKDKNGLTIKFKRYLEGKILKGYKK